MIDFSLAVVAVVLVVFLNIHDALLSREEARWEARHPYPDSPWWVWPWAGEGKDRRG